MAVDSGLKHSPSLQAFATEVQRQQELIPSAVNLPNPQVVLQNTNGLFFSMGVQQSLDFPTVYAAQKRLLSESASLAEKSRLVEVQDQKYLLHLYYADLQYRFGLLKLSQSQDSLYEELAVQAHRQFEAGEVDFLQSSYAKAEASKQRLATGEAQGEYLGAMRKLQIVTGIEEDFIPEIGHHPWEQLQPDHSRLSVGNNPSISRLQQGIVVSSNALRLEKNRALPSLTIGYINNGDYTTTIPNRVYGGVGIPLWYWQYKSRIAAARKEVEIGEYQLQAKEMQLNADLERAFALEQALSQGIREYESTVMPNAQELKEASKRMFEAGLRTYADYLRTLADVRNIELAYWEAWKSYQLNHIYIQYLCGTL